jgi:hypothetical protein
MEKINKFADFKNKQDLEEKIKMLDGQKNLYEKKLFDLKDKYLKPTGEYYLGNRLYDVLDKKYYELDKDLTDKLKKIKEDPLRSTLSVYNKLEKLNLNPKKVIRKMPKLAEIIDKPYKFIENCGRIKKIILGDKDTIAIIAHYQLKKDLMTFFGDKQYLSPFNYLIPKTDNIKFSKIEDEGFIKKIFIEVNKEESNPCYATRPLQKDDKLSDAGANLLIEASKFPFNVYNLEIISHFPPIVLIHSKNVQDDRPTEYFKNIVIFNPLRVTNP